MRVTIIRHGLVDHIWKKSCTSAEFDEECRLYDEAPIIITEDSKWISEAKSALTKSGQLSNNILKIYISTLVRTRLTAETLFGQRSFVKSDLIHEVPMRSAFDSKKRIPLWFWYVSVRLQWLCGSSRQPETMRQTKERAQRFVDEIIQRDEDCIIVTHGFFMRTLMAVMKRYGFKVDNMPLYYKNGETIVMKK